jgi:hypothetical protein
VRLVLLEGLPPDKAATSISEEPGMPSDDTVIRGVRDFFGCKRTPKEGWPWFLGRELFRDPDMIIDLLSYAGSPDILREKVYCPPS